jgi:hypothetical protein
VTKLRHSLQRGRVRGKCPLYPMSALSE